MNLSLEIARRFLDRAKGDGQAYITLVADPKIPVWILGFHAQQAVEKSLKAVLAAASIEFPRTHNLSMLIELLRRSRVPLPPDADELPQLTPFGSALRYGDLPDETDATLDRSWAGQCIDRTIRWAESFVSKVQAS